MLVSLMIENVRAFEITQPPVSLNIDRCWRSHRPASLPTPPNQHTIDYFLFNIISRTSYSLNAVMKKNTMIEHTEIV